MKNIFCTLGLGLILGSAVTPEKFMNAEASEVRASLKYFNNAEELLKIVLKEAGPAEEFNLKFKIKLKGNLDLIDVNSPIQEDLRILNAQLSILVNSKSERIVELYISVPANEPSTDEAGHEGDTLIPISESFLRLKWNKSRNQFIAIED